MLESSYCIFSFKFMSTSTILKLTFREDPLVPIASSSRCCRRFDTFSTLLLLDSSGYVRKTRELYTRISVYLHGNRFPSTLFRTRLCDSEHCIFCKLDGHGPAARKFPAASNYYFRLCVFMILSPPMFLVYVLLILFLVYVGS